MSSLALPPCWVPPRAVMGCPSRMGAVGRGEEERCRVSPSNGTDSPAASEPRSCWLSRPACPSSPLPQPKLRQTGRPSGEKSIGDEHGQKGDPKPQPGMGGISAGIPCPAGELVPVEHGCLRRPPRYH